MRNLFEGITEDHLNNIKQYYQYYHAGNKWYDGLITLYREISFAPKNPIHIVKSYYTGTFIDNVSIHSYFIKKIHDGNLCRIYDIVNYDFESDTPIFYIYEYNDKNNTCRYNIFDMFTLSYSSFLIDLTKLPEDPYNTHTITKEEAAKLLTQQLLIESSSPVISLIETEYEFKFSTQPLSEQIFDTIL